MPFSWLIGEGFQQSHEEVKKVRTIRITISGSEATNVVLKESETTQLSLKERLKFMFQKLGIRSEPEKKN